jgi:uncharacterized membrane protein
MMTTSIKTIISIALGTAMSVSTAIAADKALEKCSVVKNGKGIIKANKGDCKTAAHSCAGQNTPGEVDAFIVVPAGECIKINQGDFSGVDEKVKEKLEIK